MALELTKEASLSHRKKTVIFFLNAAHQKHEEGAGCSEQRAGQRQEVILPRPNYGGKGRSQASGLFSGVPRVPQRAAWQMWGCQVTCFEQRVRDQRGFENHWPHKARH